MRILLAIFVLVVGLGVGLLASQWFGSPAETSLRQASRTHETTPASPDANASQDTLDETDRAEPPPAPAEETFVRAAEPEKATTTEMRAELAAPLAELPVPTFPRGTGVIEGIVVDEAGQPVAGAEACAVIWGLAPGLEEEDVDPTLVDLETYIVREVEQYHYDRAMIRRAITDEDGRFQVTELVDGEYRVEVEKEGYLVCDQTNRAARRCRPGDSLSFLAHEARPLVIEVYGVEGVELATTWIHLSTKTNDEGAPVLTIGMPTSHHPRTTPIPRSATHLRARYPSGKWSAIEPIPSTGPMVFREPPGCELTGTVHNLPRGTSWYLRAVPAEGGGTPEEIFERSDSYEHSSHFAADGPTHDYRISFGNPGRYVVGLTSQGISDQRLLQVIDLVSGVSRLDFELPPIDASDMLTIHATGPDGLLEFLQVSVAAGQWTGFQQPLDVHAIGPGEFEVSVGPVLDVQREYQERMPQEAREPARLFVDAFAPGLGVTRVEATNTGRGWSADVRFDPPGSLEVRVVGLDEPSYRGRTQLQVHQLNETQTQGALFSRSAVTLPLHSMSRVELGGLAPGRYRVTAACREAEAYEQYRPVSSSDVEVVSGRTSTVVELPPLYTVEVRFDESMLGKHCWLSPETEGPRFSFSGRNRTVPLSLSLVYAGLTPGTYSLSVADESTTIEVPAQRVVHFEARPKALYVAFVAQPLESHTELRAGDILLDIDGRAVDSAESFAAAISQAPEGSTVRLGILRADAPDSVELRVSPEVKSATSRGFYFRPIPRPNGAPR